ncbi:MAG: class B sortase [Angelakisella sp.]|jgi:sortase B|nr:class B sortase [Angelakisella sp.]
MMKKLQFWQAALVFCILGFLFSAGRAASSAFQSYREDQANRALLQQVQQLSDGEKYASSGRLTRYDALYQQNNDLAGWLSFPETALDCPVMYTPEDPEKYLRMAFDGSYAISGSLFIGDGSSPDGSNVVVYGHNMKNGTMFGGLTAYAQEDYAKAHPVFRLDTLTEEREYRVIAAFYCAAEEEEAFPYQYVDLTHPETFAQYLEKAGERSLWPMSFQPEFGTRLALLSTCSYQGEDGRFVVLGAEIEADV